MPEENHVSTLLQPKPLTIFGSIYVQGGTNGLASYHFDSEDDCYISYASPECSHWPDLEDGTRPPVKKNFVNYSFDLAERIFTGEIYWTPVAWNGDKRWCYTMKFSEDFDTIESGQCITYNMVEDGDQNRIHRFGVQLVYKRLLVIK